MQKIEMRDPADLRLHPLTKRFIPDPDRESGEWLSFVDGLSAAGPEGVPEIFITDDGQVMEGGRRWRAAKQLGWAEIRCRIRPEEDAAALIVESLLGQRNMQRCAKVYIALTLLEPFVKSAEHRRLIHLRNGVKTLEKPLNGVLPSNLAKVPHRPKEDHSTYTLAEKFGVSAETVRRGIQVVELFEKEPEIKEVWEPRLLNGEKNLWNVLSAVAGAATDQSGRDKGVEQSTFDFYEGLFTPITEKNYHWNQLSSQRREQIVSRWTEEARKWKPELRSAIMKAIQEAK
jgi:ParB-like nuclease domain